MTGKGGKEEVEPRGEEEGIGGEVEEKTSAWGGVVRRGEACGRVKTQKLKRICEQE